MAPLGSVTILKWHLISGQTFQDGPQGLAPEFCRLSSGWASSDGTLILDIHSKMVPMSWPARSPLGLVVSLRSSCCRHMHRSKDLPSPDTGTDREAPGDPGCGSHRGPVPEGRASTGLGPPPQTPLCLCLLAPSSAGAEALEWPPWPDRKGWVCERTRIVACFPLKAKVGHAQILPGNAMRSVLSQTRSPGCRDTSRGQCREGGEAMLPIPLSLIFSSPLHSPSTFFSLPSLPPSLLLR